MTLDASSSECQLFILLIELRGRGHTALADSFASLYFAFIQNVDIQTRSMELFKMKLSPPPLFFLSIVEGKVYFPILSAPAAVSQFAQYCPAV